MRVSFYDSHLERYSSIFEVTYIERYNRMMGYRLIIAAAGEILVFKIVRRVRSRDVLYFLKIEHIT